MKQSFRGSVSSMRAAVASLEAVVGARVPAMSELQAWTAYQREARVQPVPLVSSSAPRSALEAWRTRHARRFIGGK